MYPTPTAWIPRPDRIWLLALVLAVTLAGCGGGGEVDRHPVFGTILGAQDRSGSISFIPFGDPPRPSATTAVEAGRYEFDRSNGPCSGQHTVIIAFQTPSQPLAPGVPQAPGGKPDKFSRPPRRAPGAPRPSRPEEKKLQVVVPSSGPWQLDFQLP